MDGRGILNGLAVTIKHFIATYVDDFKRKNRYFTPEGVKYRSSPEVEGIFTIQYPEERRILHENFRYIPFLVYDEGEDGQRDIRCTACGICAKVCPAQTIWIVRAKDPETGRPLSKPAEFYIDTTLCMNCGLCAEFCPFDAIIMDHDYEIAVYSKDHMVFDLERLLKSASYYQRIRPTQYAEKAAEREAKAKAKAAKAARRGAKK
ncbi:MAG: 4Fe-4S dicluster domain-containing protein [Chloroflexi bacterium]|nr:4Fe-4S dicluster domain-containing protein [Chloroflexota bacterium]